MRGHPTIYLFAMVFAAVLSACSSVFDAKPSSGSYAEIDIVQIAPGKPSVTIAMIRVSGRGPWYGPFARKFYVRPGEYQGFAVCNRPKPEGAILKVGAAAPAYDFDFPIADGQFTLDCRYGKGGQEFILTGDKLLFDEDTGQSIPPAPVPGTAPPPPDPGTAPPPPDPGTAPPPPNSRKGL